jgi:hypothetical protein
MVIDMERSAANGTPEGAMETEGSLVMVGPSVGDAVAGDPVGAEGRIVGDSVSGRGVGRGICGVGLSVGSGIGEDVGKSVGSGVSGC